MEINWAITVDDVMCTVVWESVILDHLVRLDSSPGSPMWRWQVLHEDGTPMFTGYEKDVDTARENATAYLWEIYRPLTSDPEVETMEGTAPN